MTTLLLAVPLFVLAVLGLALGAFIGRPSIKGSCGGCAQCLCRTKRQ